jgi:hypothetical protein
LGLRAKARVTLCAMVGAKDDPPGARVTLERSADLLRGLRFLSALKASGRDGSWRAPREIAGCSRVFWLSDPFVAEPKALEDWLAQGRELTLVQCVAPLESDPRGTWRWRCPESGQLRSAALDATAREHYLARLDACLSNWSQYAAARRARHVLISSAEPFEAALPRLLGSSAVPAGLGQPQSGRRSGSL